MPLKSEHNSLVPQTNRLLSQNDERRDQSEPSSRTSTPLHRSKELGSRRDHGANISTGSSNPTGTTLVPETHNRALAMKMKVPDTRARGLSGYQRKDKTTGVANHAILVENPQQQQQSTFDDTESFDFGDETSFQDNENRTVVFRGERPQSSQAHLFNSRGKQDQHSTFEEEAELFGLRERLPKDWQKIAQKERMRHGMASGNSGRSSQEFRLDTLKDWTQAEELQLTSADTPSRVKSSLYTPVAHPERVVKMVSFDSPGSAGSVVSREESPELVAPRNVGYSKSGQNAPRPESNKDKPLDGGLPGPGPQDIASNSFSRSVLEKSRSYQTSQNRPSISTFESSRASDCPTSSEDEVVLAQPETPISGPLAQEPKNSNKRPLDRETDYDMAALKTMKFEDLRTQKFDIDPRTAIHDIAFDSQGNTMTFLQRLSNLGRMTDEEQKTMFHNQGDEEWAQMGSWFIERFQEDLKRLMDVRLERRKISMRFEDEIRRREKNVEWCSMAVEEDLRGLKKGGGELIKGRDSASRRGTPQKK